MTTSREALVAVINMLTTVDGLQYVQEGIPELPETATAAWVTAGPRDLSDRTAGLVERALTFYIWTGYRVEGREDEAETELLDIIDGIEAAWMLARIADGILHGSTLDTSLAGAPEYRDYNEEYRIYPITMTVRVSYPTPRL
jgi:hypothetical protein